MGFKGIRVLPQAWYQATSLEERRVVRVYAKVGDKVLVFIKDMTFSESMEIAAALGQLGMNVEEAFERVEAITIRGGRKIDA